MSSHSHSNVTDLQFENQTDTNGTDDFDEHSCVTEGQSNFENEFEENSDQYENITDIRARWEENTKTFKTKFRNESITKRKRMGHQKQDFISRAAFANKQQNVTEVFKEFTSSDYGNCFTVDSPKYIATRTGPDHGIKLRLNLEVDEYIKNYASGYGVRLVFHEPGTFAMPAEEGLTLSPGHETMIGLRVVNITRLPYPFGNCTDGEAFRQRYNISYSVAACMEFCRIEMTVEQCDCVPFDAPDLHFSRNGVHVCDNLKKTEDKCADKVNYNFEPGNCDCISPCRETVYEKTISGRRWPNKDYLEKVLMEDACRRNMSSMKDACSHLRNHTFDYERYRYNFIRARIYFEELNYKKITEQEAYKAVRFVSDIGGAMGLFLGASLLSILELFQLILEVVLHARKPKQTQPSEATRREQQNGNFSPV
ncbi:amiloride-sensitive sodium channel subunit beta-like [Mercenaria mercenaria]|uniref:amiloride-sensitive sodium channel subunit beta-like n=1 Tax=Mercenaria mercenaria TaxID=6596 RepID=UPI00234EABA8|nr:amiloride-sensitive sodium channel subunit beta-like [Mercenaria mercenaria]